MLGLLGELCLSSLTKLWSTERWLSRFSELRRLTEIWLCREIRNLSRLLESACWLLKRCRLNLTEIRDRLLSSKLVLLRLETTKLRLRLCLKWRCLRSECGCSSRPKHRLWLRLLKVRHGPSTLLLHRWLLKIVSSHRLESCRSVVEAEACLVIHGNWLLLERVKLAHVSVLSLVVGCICWSTPSSPTLTRLKSLVLLFSFLHQLLYFIFLTVVLSSAALDILDLCQEFIALDWLPLPLTNIVSQSQLERTYWAVVVRTSDVCDVKKINLDFWCCCCWSFFRVGNLHAGEFIVDAKQFLLQLSDTRVNFSFSWCLVLLKRIWCEVAWLVKTRSTGSELILNRLYWLVKWLEGALIKHRIARLGHLSRSEVVSEALVSVVVESWLVVLERIGSSVWSWVATLLCEWIAHNQI